MCRNDNRQSGNIQRTIGDSFAKRIICKFLTLRSVWLSKDELKAKSMRERILFAVIFIGMLFSAVAAVPAALLAIRQKEWTVLALDGVVFVCGLYLLAAKDVKYEIKAWMACGLIYIVGVYVILFFGFLSGGPVWLFSFAVVCGLLLGLKPAIAGICINSATLAVLGWLHAATPWGDAVPFFTNGLNALAAGGNFLFLNTLVAISCALLLQDEKATSLSLKIQNAEILEAKRRLEEEVISRKQAEERQRELAKALRASEKRYRELVNDTPAGIYEIDLTNFRVANVNDVMCAYTGYAREELMALNPLALFAGDSVNHFVERGKRLFAGEDISESTEYRILKKDGAAFWARTHSKISCDKGKPVKNTMIFHNISEIKRLEEEKQRLQESLAEARTTEAIATLAGGVAHQFNNILSIVAGATDMLEQFETAPHLQSKYIKMVKESVERMASLTNQLLAYAQGGSYFARTISLSRFIADNLPRLLPQMPVPIHVEQELHQDVALIRADPKQMESVLSAILTNASEAMEEEGSVRIVCRNQNINGRDIDRYHDDLKPGRYVALTIEDNGRGMDEETRKKIFDPFFTTKFQGRGLAMPAVFGIVKNHGGWIGVNSRVGKGTRVQVLLPVTDADVRESHGTTPQPSNPCG